MVIRGVVERGQMLGRSLGFPTANVVVDDALNVVSGVYISKIVLSGVEYDGVTNVGVNPTVGGVARRSESYIFDFDGDIYGESVEVILSRMIRPEMRFESVEALRKQIELDVVQVRNALSLERSK